MCSYGDESLTCTYNTRSHNPYKLKIGNSCEDYRTEDRIEIKNITLNSPKTACTFSKNSKMLEFSAKKNMKINYVAYYPKYQKNLVLSKYPQDTEYYDIEGSVRITNQGDITNIKISGLEDYESSKSYVGFEDAYKGGAQSIVEYKGENFIINNKGLGEEGSRFHLDAVVLPDAYVGKTNLKLEYKDGQHRQIEYCTEPELEEHDLCIDLIDMNH